MRLLRASKLQRLLLLLLWLLLKAKAKLVIVELRPHLRRLLRWRDNRLLAKHKRTEYVLLKLDALLWVNREEPRIVCEWVEVLLHDVVHLLGLKESHLRSKLRKIGRHLFRINCNLSLRKNKLRRFTSSVRKRSSFEFLEVLRSDWRVRRNRWTGMRSQRAVPTRLSRLHTRIRSSPSPSPTHGHSQEKV